MRRPVVTCDPQYEQRVSAAIAKVQDTYQAYCTAKADLEALLKVDPTSQARLGQQSFPFDEIDRSGYTVDHTLNDPQPATYGPNAARPLIKEI